MLTSYETENHSGLTVFFKIDIQIEIKRNNIATFYFIIFERETFVWRYGEDHLKLVQCQN